MKNLILIACFILVVYASRKKEFDSYKKSFKKSYRNTAEENKRLEIFSQNLDKIEKLNTKLKGFELGINKYSDLNETEFGKSFFGYKSIDDTKTPQRKKRQTAYKGKKSLDWRKLNRVTAVQDQDSCGSCWVFSAAGAIEGAWAKKTGKLVDVSDQNILDCDLYGCDGGHMISAYRTIISNGGINSEINYPYLGYDQDECKYNSSQSVAKIVRYTRLPSGDEGALEKAVTEKGPIAVAVCANDYWAFAKSGVISASYCNCSLNHAVLVVGYNNKASPKYWIVKNSWGETWGEKGYLRIEKGNNACGIADDCSYPIA